MGTLSSTLIIVILLAALTIPACLLLGAWLTKADRRD
jgi:hypothetical protein